MSWKLSQNDRLFSFQSPFPAEGTLVRSLEAEESISKLFTFKIQLISDEPDLDHDTIIGKKVRGFLTLPEKRTMPRIGDESAPAASASSAPVR